MNPDLYIQQRCTKWNRDCEQEGHACQDHLYQMKKIMESEDEKIEKISNDAHSKKYLVRIKEGNSAVLLATGAEEFISACFKTSRK